METKLETLSLLELRLEISKQLAYLAENMSKRVYNGFAIIESYEKGYIDLHLHGLIANLDYKGGGKATMYIPYCGLCSARNRHGGLLPTDYEMPMLIWVGIGSEPLRPVDSVIRLQPLDSCRMGIIDTLEIGLSPSRETLRCVLDRELRTLLLSAGVKLGEREDEIINGCPEMTQNLSDEITRMVGNRSARTFKPEERNPLLACLPFVGLHVKAIGSLDGLSIFLDYHSTKVDQLKKAFFCPGEPDISVIKRMAHELYSRNEKATI